jgi:hypothetical protein
MRFLYGACENITFTQQSVGVSNSRAYYCLEKASNSTRNLMLGGLGSERDGSASVRRRASCRGRL